VLTSIVQRMCDSYVQFHADATLQHERNSCAQEGRAAPPEIRAGPDSRMIRTVLYVVPALHDAINGTVIAMVPGRQHNPLLQCQATGIHSDDVI